MTTNNLINTTLLFSALTVAISCKNAEQKAEQSDTEQATLIAEPNAVESKMVWVPGGKFKMGSADPDFADAQPLHEVQVDGFWMDEHEVTNAEFTKFVKATGYKTIAELPLDPKEFPGVPEADLVPGSAVFTPPTEKVSLNDPLQWWKYVSGANWQHPFGPGSSIKEKENEPVVHISYKMPSPMQNGLESGSLQKLNGSLQRREAGEIKSIIGEMN